MHDPAQIASGDLDISFEFFPPKTPEGTRKLDETVERLTSLAPRFFSVTYGAGGGTQERTTECVRRLAARSGVEVAHHLTCVGATRAEIDELAARLWADGVRHIVALRGDPPDGSEYEPHPDGYPFAPDLVAGLKRIADFQISVAAYPETHPKAMSAESDMDNLKRKFDAGATRAITQYAFDTEEQLRFIDRARAAGIEQEIVAGIMPVGKLDGLVRFSAKCGATVPDWLVAMFEGLDDEPETRQMIAASVAIEQCRRLRDAGATSYHFYTLNRAEVSRAACLALGIRDADDDEPVRARA